MKGGKRLTEEARATILTALKYVCNDYGERSYVVRSIAILELDDEPEYCTWKREGVWLRSPHGRMISNAYGSLCATPAFCQDCGKPVKGE